MKSKNDLAQFDFAITELSEIDKIQIVGGTLADEIGYWFGKIVNAIEDMDTKNTYPNSMIG